MHGNASLTNKIQHNAMMIFYSGLKVSYAKHAELGGGSWKNCFSSAVPGCQQVHEKKKKRCDSQLAT